MATVTVKDPVTRFIRRSKPLTGRPATARAVSRPERGPLPTPGPTSRWRWAEPASREASSGGRGARPAPRTDVRPGHRSRRGPTTVFGKVADRRGDMVTVITRHGTRSVVLTAGTVQRDAVGAPRRAPVAVGDLVAVRGIAGGGRIEATVLLDAGPAPGAGGPAPGRSAA